MNKTKTEIAQLEKTLTVLFCHPQLMRREYWITTIVALLERTDVSLQDRRLLAGLLDQLGGISLAA
jgi:hypothetical protein